MTVALKNLINVLVKGILVSILGILSITGIFIINAFAELFPGVCLWVSVALYFALCTIVGLAWNKDLFQKLDECPFSYSGY